MTGINNGKRIKLFDTKEVIYTSWGAPYTLYAGAAFYDQNNAIYYTDAGEGTEEVMKLGEFENIEHARVAFEKHMAFLEQEN